MTTRAEVVAFLAERWEQAGIMTAAEWLAGHPEFAGSALSIHAGDDTIFFYAKRGGGTVTMPIPAASLSEYGPAYIHKRMDEAWGLGAAARLGAKT